MKIGYLLLLLVLVLASCSTSSNISYGNNLISEDEMNIEIMTVRSQDIAPSNQGIYYIIGDYLYFYDFETQKHVLLCNKPNCNHNLETDQFIGQECNAYLQNASFGGFVSPSQIIYNNGYIYMIQDSLDFQTGMLNGQDIIRINKDGTNRTVILHTDESINKIFIHKNILYYKTYATEYSNNKLYQFDLNSSSGTPKEVFENQIGHLGSVFCKDNYLYIATETYTDFESNEMYYGVYGRLNLDSNVFEILKENETVNDSVINNFVLIDNDRIAYLHQNDTYVYNFNTKEESYMCDESTYINVTKNYIFISDSPIRTLDNGDKRIVSVYDKELNLVSSIELLEGMTATSRGAYNDQLFIKYDDPSEDSSISRIYRFYVDNKQLKYEIFAEADTSLTMGGYRWNANDYK